MTGEVKKLSEYFKNQPNKIGIEDDALVEKDLYDSQSHHDRAFENLEKINEFVIKEVELSEEGHISLDSVREQFKVLWDGIKLSHSNEMSLSIRDRQVSKDLSEAMAKTRMLIKISQNDPIICKHLSEKLEKAWNLSTIGGQEEKETQEKINSLRDEINNLNKNIESAAKFEGQETVQELLKLKRELEEERNQISMRTEEMRGKLIILKEKRVAINNAKQANKEKIIFLEREHVVQKEGIERETTRKVGLEEQTNEIVARIENKRRDLDDINKRLISVQERVIQVEKAVKDQREINELDAKESELSNGKLEKLKTDFQAQQLLVSKMSMELFRKNSEIKVMENGISDFRNDLIKMARSKSLYLRKIILGKANLASLEKERETLKQRIIVLEKELEEEQNRIAKSRKYVENMDRERVILKRNFQRASEHITNQQINNKSQEITLANTHSEVQKYQKEIKQQKDIILKLDKDRDHYSHEATKLAHHIGLRLEELKKTDISILDYKRKLATLEDQLRKQQQIADNASYEKLMFTRNLREMSSQSVDNSVKIAQMKRTNLSTILKFKEKEDLIERNAEEYEQMLNETVHYKSESKKIKKMCQDLEHQVIALEQERSIITSGISEGEAELSKQHFFASNAESREKVYQRKLMERVNELRDIWEKFRISQSELRIGAYHFRNIVKEIRELRVEILSIKLGRLNNSNEETKTAVNVRQLVGEISFLENLIAKESCMCNALKDRLRYPINVHRWRVLEAFDPQAFDILQKINEMSKRLVCTNYTLKEKDSWIVKQKMYIEIREVLSNSPGLETQEEACYIADLVQVKRKQLKDLVKDLKMAEESTKFYRNEICGFQNRFNEMRKEYFMMLRIRMSQGNHLQQEKMQMKAITAPLEMEKMQSENNN